MSATHPKLARRARLRFDEREQKHMILYPERGLVLNASAAAIVQLCDGTRTIEEIVAALADGADAPRERVDGDVRSLIARLSDKGLVE
jgi:pyrroloquinoline quinone biosynthesis protein D